MPKTTRNPSCPAVLRALRVIVQSPASRSFRRRSASPAGDWLGQDAACGFPFAAYRLPACVEVAPVGGVEGAAVARDLQVAELRRRVARTQADESFGRVGFCDLLSENAERNVHIGPVLRKEFHHMVVRASVNLFVVEYHQVVAAVMGVFDQRGVGDQLHFVGVALHAGQVSRFGQRRVKIRLPHGGVFADVNLIGELLRELVVDVGVVVEPVGGLVIVRVDHLHFVQPLDGRR